MSRCSAYLCLKAGRDSYTRPHLEELAIVTQRSDYASPLPSFLVFLWATNTNITVYRMESWGYIENQPRALSLSLRALTA